MAISTGSPLEYNDLKAKYDSFNSFINTWRNWGGTNIATLVIPNANSLVDDSNINTLNSKINEFKADEYLSTKNWWTNATVTVGSLVQPVNLTGGI